jgi:GT2 family glycosyltransferase
VDDLTVVFYIRNRVEPIKKAVNSIFKTADGPVSIMAILDNCDIGTRIEMASFLNLPHYIVDVPSKSSCAHLWNLGITLTRSRYVMLCNDDVVFNRGWYGKLQELIDSKLECMLFFNHGAFVIDKSIIPILGYPDERFTQGWYEDTDYWVRCKQRGVKVIEMERGLFVSHDRVSGNGSWEFEENKKFFYKKWMAPEVCPDGGTDAELNMLFKQRIADVDWYPHYTEYCRRTWPHA